MENINYILTPDMAKGICKYFEKDVSELDELEISELTDKFIDTMLYNLDLYD